MTMRTIVDSSHWNKIDWTVFRPDILIAKCTEGVGFVDNTYQKNLTEAKKRNIPFGAYHFANKNDPVKEAEFFLSKAGDPDFYALDAETGQSMEWCKTFCDRVSKTGKTVILYAPMSTITDIGYPTWIPRYKYAGGDTKDDGIPDYKYQPTKPWDIWQYTSNGVVPGVAGRVDLNVVTDEFYNVLTIDKETGMGTMDKDFVKAVGEVCGKEYGENLNESEQKEATKKLKEAKVELLAAGQLRLTNARLLENNGELLVKNRELEEEVARLSGETADIKSYSISGLFGEILKRLINSK